MPIIDVNGQQIEFPDTMSPDEIKGVLRQKFPPTQSKTFMEKTSADIDKRRAMGEKIQANPEISAPSKALQLFGNVGGGFVNDTLLNAGGSILGAADSIIDRPAGPNPNTSILDIDPVSAAYRGVKYLGSAIADSSIGNAIKSSIARGGEGYQKLENKYPELIGDVSAVGNLFGVATSANPARGAVGIGLNVAKDASKYIGKQAVKLPLKAAIGTAKVASGITEKVGGALSNQVIKANLSPELRNLNPAEALFMRTLQQEGVSPARALGEMSQARSVGATPSVAVTSSIPSMEQMGFAMSQGSSGSRVAKKAVEDITKNQIPMLNKKIIETASGGKVLNAEQYGASVAKMSKDAIDNQVLKLKTRAAPYYQKAVGVDKSVDISNPLMQKALQNPLVVKSLEDARLDPFTLTNVKNELTELGVAVDDLSKLPYNSTVSLHAARTHLRGMADKAFAAGEAQNGRAIKSALSDIDNAIESQFPDYKMARKIYSEDAGALKVLKDSPLGKMAVMGEGDLSKIANNLMSKDPAYINKFMARVSQSGADTQKMRDAIAGAYLKRKLEDSAKEGLRFGDAVFKNETVKNQLKSIVGDVRYNQMEKYSETIDQLFDTTRMLSGSRTSAVQSLKEAPIEMPTSKIEFLDSIRRKFTPSLLDIVQKNPQSASRFNELMFTDEGAKFLEKMSAGKTVTIGDIKKVSDFLNSPNTIKYMGKAQEILPETPNIGKQIK